MKKSKDTQLPGRTASERSRQSRVADRKERLLARLKEIRQIGARGRFGVLDDALGREAGFTNRVFRGEERLTDERLLASLDFLDEPEPDFFETIYPPDPVPRYRTGFLTNRREKIRAVPKIDFLEALRSWGATIEIEADGEEFPLEAEKFDELLNADRAAAFRMACSALEAVLILKPPALSFGGGANLCRVLSPLADLLRHRGDRNSACELLELAFRLETRLVDLDLRSRLFRSASYLLCDLAYLDEARQFARRAVRLATLGGNQHSLGKSLYVEGVMLRRCGEREQAIPFLESSLQYLPSTAKIEQASALFALAYSRLESEELEGGDQDLKHIEELLPARTGREYAKLLLARAELASLRGEDKEAVEHFTAAHEEFVSSSGAEDVAICGFKWMRHLLGVGGVRESNNLARELLPLAGQLKHNRAGQAFLLEIVNLARQGELTEQVLELALSQWLCPWEQRRSS